MIDPSLLVEREGVKALRASSAETSTSFLVPGSVYNAIRDGSGWQPLWREYGEADPTPIDEARSLIAEELVTPFMAGSFETDHPLYATYLEIAGGQRILAETWFLEWVFLTTQSWVAAASRRTFDAFKRAGAIAIEMPREAFDFVVRRTPRVMAAAGQRHIAPPDVLTANQRVRAVAKWVAAGGSPWTFLLGPFIGAFAATASGIFLLFDP